MLGLLPAVGRCVCGSSALIGELVGGGILPFCSSVPFDRAVISKCTCTYISSPNVVEPQHNLPVLPKSSTTVHGTRHGIHGVRV